MGIFGVMGWVRSKKFKIKNEKLINGSVFQGVFHSSFGEAFESKFAGGAFAAGGSETFVAGVGESEEIEVAEAGHQFYGFGFGEEHEWGVDAETPP